MSRRRSTLPSLLPVFPLSSVLLLPGCRLPLNIFEPRYVQMFEEAAAGEGMVGMIQPLDEDDEDDKGNEGNEGNDQHLQRIGCAGRILRMQASGDGRYVVALEGVSRFEVVREIASDRLYRIIEPSWTRFASDLDNPVSGRVDREELIANVRAYFDVRGLEANWRTIDDSDDEELVNALSMVCPFLPTDKQLLLEAIDITERGKLVIALMNMAVLLGDAPETVQ